MARLSERLSEANCRLGPRSNTRSMSRSSGFTIEINPLTPVEKAKYAKIVSMLTQKSFLQLDNFANDSSHKKPPEIVSTEQEPSMSSSTYRQVADGFESSGLAIARAESLDRDNLTIASNLASNTFSGELEVGRTVFTNTSAQSELDDSLRTSALGLSVNTSIF